MKISFVSNIFLIMLSFKIFQIAQMAGKVIVQITFCFLNEFILF